MTGKPIEVLLVEDDPDQAALISRIFGRQEITFGVTVVADGAACLDALACRGYGIVLLDYSLPDANGLEVLAAIRARGLTVPVVMVTTQGDERVAVEAVQAGATDYVIKTAGYLTTLPTVASKVLKQHELARENERLYGEARRALAELEATQEQLVRGATLRALGEMAAGAAHHLNNLLLVVTGHLELIAATEAGEPLRRHLRILQQAAWDAVDVVRRLQQFGRTRAPDQGPVDLNQVATDVLELTRVRWENGARLRGVTIVAGLDAGRVRPVMGNAAALREVVTNLVLNALDAMAAGGRLSVRTWEAEGWVHLAVSDTGVGMSEAVRARALEPFFTTKGPDSTGLGLSVSFGTVRQHGGELEVASAEGAGTTVTLRLPAWTRPVEAPAAPPAPPVRARRVLVVDDDDAVRSALVELLVLHGHAALEAPGGREALRRLEGGERVDFVLTDLGMPGMTGGELARAVKARWPRLPVVLLTGWGDHPDAGEGAGAVDLVLAKPVTAGALSAAMAVCDRLTDSPLPR